MAEAILVYGYPVEGHGPVDPGYGRPNMPPHGGHPLPLPPLPPGVVAPPIALPPVMWPPAGPGSPPVIINPIPPSPGTPDNSLPMPPATIWPPLPPGTGIAGKALLLVWVVGVGYRWIVVGGTDIWPPQTPPPSAQPK